MQRDRGGVGARAGWLALVGAVLAALGAAYLAGRRDSRDARHAKAARQVIAELAIAPALAR